MNERNYFLHLRSMATPPLHDSLFPNEASSESQNAISLPHIPGELLHEIVLPNDRMLIGLPSKFTSRMRCKETTKRVEPE